MDNIAKYRLNDAKRHRMLRKYARLDDPSDLSAELALTRLLVSEAAQDNNTLLVDRLVNSLAKLSKSHVDSQRMRGELFSRATVAKLLTDCVDLLARALEGRFPDWETVLDGVADEIMHKVENTKHEAAK